MFGRRFKRLIFLYKHVEEIEGLDSATRLDDQIGSEGVGASQAIYTLVRGHQEAVTYAAAVKDR